MHVSGREVRAAGAAAPLWLIELNFDLLRMVSPHNELQEILGFFEQCAGEGASFYFEPPTLSPAMAQPIGTGDGTATMFPFIVSIGGYQLSPAGVGTVSAVYFDGVVQSGGYTVNNAPLAPTVTFTTPPGAAVAVTAEFDWYFLCRFEDDDLDLEEFMANLYALQSLQLKSVRS